MTNIFREAQILREKHPLSEEKQEIVSAAMIPLTILPEFSDMTTEAGLEALARMIENESAEEDQQTPAPIEENTTTKRDDGNNNFSTLRRSRQSSRNVRGENDD